MEGHLISHSNLFSGYQRRCMYQIYMWCKYFFYCMNIGWIVDWSDVCWIGWNELIRIGVIMINVNRFGISVIPDYRIFAPNFFNFENIFALRIFENIPASKVFTFTLHCAMPWQASPCRRFLTSWWLSRRCQFPCSQICETKNFFAQNMPKTIDWLESQSTRVPDVCPSTDGKTIWIESYLTQVTGVCPSTDAETIWLES